MKRTDRELQQTRVTIGFLEVSMAVLKRERLPLSRSRFTLVDEPVIEQLTRLRAEIAPYLASDPRNTERQRREP